MTDLNNLLSTVRAREAQRLIDSTKETLIRVWTGNWDLFGTIDGEFSHDFTFARNDSDTASVKIPIDHWVAEMLVDETMWPTKSMYLTFDQSGARWSGRIESKKVISDYTGGEWLELTAIHDYQKLKDLLVWANPFLPAEVQFPKAWMLYGPARWVVTVTLFVNLLRKNNSLWMVPDNPVNVLQWVDLDMSSWNMVVKPVDILGDSSIPTVVHSRFKTFHETVRHVCDDAGLVITARRWLTGDPLPWAGANLRNGCLVFDVQDKSGLQTGTGLFGTITNGIQHGVRRIFSDGMTESFDYIPLVEQPEDYNRPFWRGTVASAPWVVLSGGPHSSIETSEYEYVPPGQSQFVTGGGSMPGVNEGLKAAIIGVGGMIGSIVNQSQIGSMAAEVLEPLYSDVFLAFMAHKLHSRIAQQGWDFPFEKWVDGADKAYTLSSVITMRKAKEETRERRSLKVTMQDGQPYLVGDQGFGDFFIGDRVAFNSTGMPKDKLFIEAVDKLTYTRSDTEQGWEIEIGKREFDSGLTFLTRKLEDFSAGLKERGLW